MSSQTLLTIKLACSFSYFTCFVQSHACRTTCNNSIICTIRQDKTYKSASCHFGLIFPLSVCWITLVFQRAFTPASFNSVETCLLSTLLPFVWAGVNAAIALWCTLKADQTSVHLYDLVSVHFQANVGVICLGWEHLNQPKSTTHCALLD